MFANFCLITLLFAAQSIYSLPISNSSLFHYKSLTHRSLAKRALSYIANDTVCIIDNLIYQNGDPLPTDDPCESCKCRPPGFACVLKECDVRPGCKEIPVEGECCPSYQCGCEHDGRFYKDGEIVPNPNKLLNCYKCKCKGSSIICGLMDCQFRFDCQSRYKPGECCPNYDHCESASTSTTQQSVVFENQTIDQLSSIINTNTPSTETTAASSAQTSSSTKPTTLKASSTFVDFPEKTTVSPKESNDNQTPEPSFSSKNSNEQADTLTSNQRSSTSNELFSQFTASPDILSSSTLDSNKVILDKQTDDDDDVKSVEKSDAKSDINDSNNEVNSMLSGKVIPSNDTLESNVEDEVKLSNQSATSSSSVDEMMVSNFDSNSITQSPSNDATPIVNVISNQVDQLDRRVDESIASENEDANEDKNRNEILDESPSFQPTILPELAKSNTQQQQLTTTAQSLIEASVPSSTTIPNITDTTILAPNTNSMVSSITQSPIAKEDDLTKGKDDSNVETKDSSMAEKDEENLVKKMEEKLEETKTSFDDRSTIEDEEMRTPLELLRKVLENCSNGRCNSMEKLIKTTEDVLREFDSRIIEKIKLTDAFDRLKNSLISSSTVAPSTDSPILGNTTDSGTIELDEENYPTTLRYVKTSDLVAEHKEIDGDDLELEDLTKI